MRDHHRAADCAAKVVKAELVLGDDLSIGPDRCEWVPGIKVAVSHVFIHVAVNFIRARLQNNVEDGAPAAAVLSRKPIGDGLEFGNRIGRRINDDAFGRPGKIEVAIQVPGICTTLLLRFSY